MNREDREESGYEETLALLREAHREPIPEAHFAAVRARVLSQLAAERRPWWQSIWAYGFAAAAAAAILLAAFWPKHTVERTPLNPVVTQAADQGVSPTSVETGHARRAPAAHIHRRRTVPALAAYRVIGPPNPLPLVVKLVTNDPNVVIYWISGE